MGAIKDLLKTIQNPNPKPHDFLRNVVAGSMYRMSDFKSQSDISDIQKLIDIMRALAKDSQVATALSYYATDATTPNSSGDIIWAVPTDDSNQAKTCCDVVNALFKRWSVNTYARDHILELATVGNLYIPTTHMQRELAPGTMSHAYIGLDQNNIPEPEYDIIPSHSLDPKNVVHIWSNYSPQGYLYDASNDGKFEDTSVDVLALPENSIVHFSLGGLIGKYTISQRNLQGEEVEYDIQFADPLMTSAVQPTQTLNLLEDATILSSLIKVVRFISINCQSADEEEQTATLMQFKQIIEQQISLNTGAGDAQSFMNPQSPNNIVYLPMVNGSAPIEITDLNMKDDSEGNDKLLEYYQDKKLSVLGIPKEALNFSSSEGLGGAGAVMSQRSALYANALQRIETAYIDGWTSALNMYFQARNLNQYVGMFELHMNPILTEMSTIQFDRRDSALSQVQTLIDIVQGLGVDDSSEIKSAIIEILSEALPKTSSSVSGWNIDTSAGEESEEY